MKSTVFPTLVSITLFMSHPIWAISSTATNREVQQYLPWIIKSPPVSVEFSGCTDPGTGQYFGGGYITLFRNNESRPIFITQYEIEYQYEESPTSHRIFITTTAPLSGTPVIRPHQAIFASNRLETREWMIQSCYPKNIQWKYSDINFVPLIVQQNKKYIPIVSRPEAPDYFQARYSVSISVTNPHTFPVHISYSQFWVNPPFYLWQREGVQPGLENKYYYSDLGEWQGLDKNTGYLLPGHIATSATLTYTSIGYGQEIVDFNPFKLNIDIAGIPQN